MNISKYLFGIWCGLFAACTFAAVPIIFQAGTTAQASQVNQNFADLDGRMESQQVQINTLLTQVAALQAQPAALQVKANGVNIGPFVQTGGVGFVVQRSISSANYLFDVIASGNDSAPDPEFIGQLTNLNLLFETSDCTGPAYVLTTGANLDEKGVTPGQGFVFRVGDAGGSRGNFYVPAGSKVLSHTYASGATGSGCNVAPLTDTGVAVFPNDPVITGVPDQPFSAPITIGH